MELTESRLLRQVGQGQRLIEVGIESRPARDASRPAPASGDRRQTPLHGGVVLDQMGEQ